MAGREARTRALAGRGIGERVPIVNTEVGAKARACDRAYVGVPQLLFEHVVEAGLGILACHRGRGGAYDVFPIHWPRRNVVDAREREELVKRYRPQFEESGVIPPVARSYPKL